MEREFVIWTKFKCASSVCVLVFVCVLVHHQNDVVRILVGRKKFDASDSTPGSRRLE